MKPVWNTKKRATNNPLHEMKRVSILETI